MSRPRKPRAARGDDLTYTEQCFLVDAFDAPKIDTAERWSLRWDHPLFRPGRPNVAELWKEYGADVLRTWINKRPGTRPSLWWKYSAPEPLRRRFDGKKTTYPEGFGAPSLHLGLPEYWLALGPFESQARYLDRHGLLSEAERRRLPANAFEPVTTLE
jgi:hypothetical protein